MCYVLAATRTSPPPDDRNDSRYNRDENTQWFDGSDESLRLSDSTMRWRVHPSSLKLLQPPSKPTFRAADKVYLKPEERTELHWRLRQPRDWHRGLPDPIYIFRYGLDDLRLYNALEAAGLAGIALVADRIEDAQVVLATRRKRTGKDLSLVNIKRAADNSKLPFHELRSISPERIFEVLGPMLGLGSHLVFKEGKSQSFQLLPKAEEDGSQAILDLLAQIVTPQESKASWIRPPEDLLDMVVMTADRRKQTQGSGSRLQLIKPQVSRRSKRLILQRRPRVAGSVIPRVQSINM
jgi:hypothetical protein